MKINKKFYILWATIIVTHPVFADIALSIDGNYVSQTNYSTNTTGGNTSSTASGYGLTPSARYEFPVTPLLVIGIGVYGAFGSVYPTLTNGATSDKLTGIGFGGDFWLTLEAKLPIKPFARFMIGRLSLEEQVTVPTQAGTYLVTMGASALQYNILGGLRFPVIPLLEIFVQGGYSGTGTQTPYLKSATLNGASTSSVTVATASAYTTGFLVGAGIMLKF